MDKENYFEFNLTGETGYQFNDSGNHYSKKALVGLHYFGIEQLPEQTIIQETERGPYDIIPFIFEEEGLRENIGGAHFVLPAGVASRPVMITEPNYKITSRAVEGSGWILRWHPQRGINITWVDTRLGKRNPFVTSGYQWIVSFIANPEAKELIIEGVEKPRYDDKFETEVKLKDRDITLTVNDVWGERTTIYPLGEFWYHLNKLAKPLPLLSYPLNFANKMFPPAVKIK